MSESAAIANANGNRVRGRPFAVGNRGGPGSPYVAQLAALRADLMRSATPERMARLHRRLFALALQKADLRLALAAIELLMNRVYGKPVTPLLVGDARDEFARRAAEGLLDATPEEHGILLRLAARARNGHGEADGAAK